MTHAARSLNLSGDGVQIPAATFEHEGFRRWVTSPEFPERGHATFAEAEVFFDMSPESIETHNKVKEACSTTLGQLVREQDLGELYVDRALLTNERAEFSTEPDLMFASFATIESGRLALPPADSAGVELVGSPDMVLEIVSTSSVRKDTVTLKTAYARAGIGEYWLVDARGSELRFEILRLEGGLYLARADATRPQHSEVFARHFTLSRERNRVGRFRYRLEY